MGHGRQRGDVAAGAIARWAGMPAAMTRGPNRMDVQRLKVLVVDDEPAICNLMQVFLSQQGYEVHTVDDGEQALRQFRADPPDMVLLDISMPGMSGTEVLEQIRDSGHRCGVIVLSAYGDGDTIRSALGRGAYCYIQKPMELSALATQLKALQQSLRDPR
jgi:two-component system response regulator TctD